MAKPTLSPPIFFLFVLVSILYLGGSGSLNMANGQKTWCIANPLSSDSALAANIEYACSQLDCRLILPDSPCFEPDTLLQHASFVMNLYYQANGRHLFTCDFRNTGLVSLTDPSHDNCTFESGGVLAEQEPSLGTWCVAKPGTSDELLEQNINFACNQVDCSPTHVGGACFYPTNLINHASYAMNLYYQATRTNSSCNFRETGLLVSTDPSYGNCSYRYSHN